MSLDSMRASFSGIDDGVSKFGELANLLDEEGESFATEYLKNAGIAYHEGSDIFPLIHDSVEQALEKFRNGVNSLKNEGSNLKESGELTRENEEGNKKMFEAHINENIATTK